MALQLCVVLEYLHTCQPPIVFRDLKPGNIIRTPTGNLCLIDFGIARQFRPGQMRDTQRLGSPGYAAPEQYGHAQTTPQADIYSLGALLHTLLSGQDPATQPRGLAPLRLSGYASEAELVGLVQQMLEPDPEQRPAQVSDVAAVLKRIQEEQQPISDGPRIWIPPAPQEPPEEHLTGSGTQRHIQLQVPAPPQQMILNLPAQRPSRRNVLIGLGAAAIALASGEIIWRAMALRTTPTPAATLLYTYSGHTDAVWGSYWSPDSARIASCSLDDTVQIWDALSGQHTFVYHGHSDGVMDAAWMPMVDKRMLPTERIPNLYSI